MFVFRPLQVPIIHIPEVLGELPAMALRVYALVDAVAPELIGRFVKNPGASAQGALIVGVNVIHEDVESLADAAIECPRTFPGGIFGSKAQHDKAVGKLHLAMHNSAILVGHPQADFEPKGFAQPVNGRGDVVVKEVRGDSGHVVRGI